MAWVIEVFAKPQAFHPDREGVNMALRAHVKDGKIVCSGCAAIVGPDSSACPQCSEDLAGDLEAMICPYCSAVIKRFSSECSHCGLRFKAMKKPTVEKSTEDEEFLKRLLEWGKKMQTKDAEDVETDEDLVEKEQAHSVIKAVLGSKEPTTIQKETIIQIEKTAMEKKDLEVREESILTIAEPLEAALRARHASIQEAEAELVEISKELDELNSRQDPKAVTKREKLERKRALLETEKSEIQKLEAGLNSIDETYKKLLADHKRELEAKEANLKARLDAFKMEMERREDEKRRMEKKEAMLHIQEKEAAAKLERLAERERLLEAREKEVNRQLDELKAQRDATPAGTSSPPAANTYGKWIIDPNEVEDVFKKSKKAREDWFAEQRRIQKELVGVAGSPAPILVGADSITGREIADSGESHEPSRHAELDDKIARLEATVSRLEKERQAVQAAENAAKEFDEDLKKVLKVVDDLLGKLPDDSIDAFAKSDAFKMYQKVLDRYLGEG